MKDAKMPGRATSGKAVKGNTPRAFMDNPATGKGANKKAKPFTNDIKTTKAKSF